VRHNSSTIKSVTEYQPSRAAFLCQALFRPICPTARDRIDDATPPAPRPARHSPERLRHVAGHGAHARRRLHNAPGQADRFANNRLALYADGHALREALLQFTQEIVAREGFPIKLFVSRFEEAVDWHRDRFLRMVEGFDPQMAAQINTRSLTDVPTEAQPPCIFPG
jgi:hypothetical protein